MPAKTIEIDQTQIYLQELLSLVITGTEIIFTQGNTPIARLTPIADEFSESLPDQFGTKKSRPFGLCAGEFAVPDDFDDPLPEAMLQEFEGR